MNRIEESLSKNEGRRRKLIDWLGYQIMRRLFLLLVLSLTFGSMPSAGAFNVFMSIGGLKTCGGRQISTSNVVAACGDDNCQIGGTVQVTGNGKPFLFQYAFDYFFTSLVPGRNSNAFFSFCHTNRQLLVFASTNRHKKFAKNPHVIVENIFNIR